ncbi:MAG: serine/threonine protein kinase [Gemmatimonadetes bacterium]|nr:serine/threonine protein kinase [Gemmatimonadota bacterium]
MSETPAPEFLALQAAVAGRYSLERELGRGGMGIVYLARDVALERPVAIKLLPPAVAAHPGIREGFLREARLAAGLSHPNVVSIHLVEARDDLVYFVMGYIEGETLAQRVRRAGPLPVAEATRLLQEVAWALAYAHGRDIVHRDVKPENILIERATGRALVTDFGIARRTDAPGAAGDEVIGTAHYMSPEQAAAEPVDARSDLYSLGVTGFFALTGQLPFEGPTLRAILVQHLTQPAPPVTSQRPALPRQLAEAIDRCLAKDPAARFASGEELAEAIGAVRDATLEVPAVIRRFERAIVITGLLAVGFGVVFAWMRLMAPTGSGGVGSVLLAIWALSVLDVLSHARLVIRGGFGRTDVAAGFLAEARSREEEEAEFFHGAGPHAGRLLRLLQRPAPLFPPLGVGALALGVLLPTLGVRSPSARVALALLGTFVLTLAVPLALVSPARPRIWSRLAAGGPGRVLFGLAGIGLRPRPRTAPALQPTEVLLGRAVASLIDSLPQAYHEQLSEVTGVVRRLEARAQALRLRSAELAQAIADAGPARGNPRFADLEAARRDADARLAAALAALENLRLALLKIRAGVGSPGELAADVDAARRITRDEHPTGGTP